MPTFKDRTGEVKKMNCGMNATIIEYVNSHDITIKFEDGEILKHKFYGDFKNGKIDNPNLKTNFQDRVGTKKKMKCGLYATIIAYRKSSDIDVCFDDGVVVCNRMYQDFVRGEITHPKNKIDISKIIGLKSTMHCGMEATIIAYRNSGDIDVMFADGVIVNHRTTLEDITHAMNEILSNYSWIKKCDNYPVEVLSTIMRKIVCRQ